MKFVLSEEDAARLDCPREVEYDQARVMYSELRAMRRIGWSLERLEHAMIGVPVSDGNGGVLYETDENGQPKTDPAGNRIVLLAPDLEGLAVMVWLGVRRATGREVDWDTFDLDIRAVAESLEDENPGKAKTGSSRATRSKTSTSRTRRR